MNLIKRTTDKPVKRAIRRYQPSNYYNPFKNLFDLMDYRYSPFFDYSPSTDYSYPKLNMYDDGDQYVVEVDVPGYSEEDLNISIDGNQLTIEGSYSEETEDTSRYLVKERYYGKFVRTVSLPQEVEIDGTEARLEQGLLYLRVPKLKEISTPKTINIVSK